MRQKVMSLKNLKQTLAVVPFLIVGIFFPILAASEMADYIALQNGLTSGTYGAGILRLIFAVVFLGVTMIFMKKNKII
jgi:hypothetical protein